MLNNTIRFAFASAQHTPFCVIGGGSGGLNVVGQLLRQKGVLRSDIRVFEPSKLHYYQPGWTMVAGCIYDAEKTVKLTREVIHQGVAIVDQSVTRVNPDKNEIITEDGSKWSYDQLIIASGVKCDYSLIKGCQEALEDPNCPVGSAYWIKYADKFQRLMRNFYGGHAVFTEPVFPIKCGGAPQKVLYLIDDFLTQKGLRQQTNISFFKAIDVVFPVPKYSQALAEILKERQVPVHFKHSLIEVRGKERVAIFQNLATNKPVEVQFDILHVVPPHRPPTFIKDSGIGDANGYVNVNPKTLQHAQYNNIWALGDSSNLPTSKTVAALLSQTPILIDNLFYARQHKGSKQLPETYDGYTSCPILVGRNQLMLCEFKYALEVDESFYINQAKPRKIFYYLKKDFFPWVYWNLIPKGYWYGRKAILPNFTRAILQ